MRKHSVKRGEKSFQQQAGRYIVTWIAGVAIATAVIGAALYFGLGMLGGNGQRDTAAMPASHASPSVAREARIQAQPLDANTEDTSESAEILNSDDSASDTAARVQHEPTSAEDTPVMAAVAPPQPTDEVKPAGRRAPITRIAPRAPTAGGVAAARLPNGEEILVPAGERVDEYVRKRAAELGITLPEQEDGGNAVVEPRSLDELSEAELRELEQAEEVLFQDEADTVGTDNFGLEADDPQPRAPN